jgi:hypothetical protein
MDNIFDPASIVGQVSTSVMTGTCDGPVRVTSMNTVHCGRCYIIRSVDENESMPANAQIRKTSTVLVELGTGIMDNIFDPASIVDPSSIVDLASTSVRTGTCNGPFRVTCKEYRPIVLDIISLDYLRERIELGPGIMDNIFDPASIVDQASTSVRVGTCDRPS